MYKTHKVARIVLNGDVTGEDRYNPKYKYYEYDYLFEAPILNFFKDCKKN